MTFNMAMTVNYAMSALAMFAHDPGRGHQTWTRGLSSTTTWTMSGGMTIAVRALSVFRQHSAYAFDIFADFGHCTDQIVFTHAKSLRPIGHFVRFCHVDAASRYRR